MVENYEDAQRGAGKGSNKMTILGLVDISSRFENKSNKQRRADYIKPFILFLITPRR